MSVSDAAKGIRSNGSMIIVTRDNGDGTVSIMLRTYRVDSVRRYLRGKSLRRYAVSQ